METPVLPVILIWQTLVFTRLLRQLFQQLCWRLYLRRQRGNSSTLLWEMSQDCSTFFPPFLSACSLVAWCHGSREEEEEEETHTHNTFLLKNDVTITYKPVIPCALIYHHVRHTAKAGVAFMISQKKCGLSSKSFEPERINCRVMTTDTPYIGDPFT